ncbi:hypothetical protein PMIN05_010516 [Paraphaeosphaeria minitans]
MSSSRTELIKLQSSVIINAIISQPDSLAEHENRPTVVFLHFWGGSVRTWSLVKPHISAKYQTVALDFRGWGNSTGPDDPEAYSIAAQAEDVEATIRAIGLRKTALVGLSMGAKVAQLVASRMCSGAEISSQAKTLVGLVLISPAPLTPLCLPPDMRQQQLHAYDNRESAAFVAKLVLTASFHDRDLPEFVVDDMIRGSKWARGAWPAYAMGEDVSGEVAEIAVPVLVLAAAKDLAAGFEWVGTSSPLDVPEAVAEHIVQFLDAL